MTEDLADFFERCPGLYLAVDGQGAITGASRDLRRRFAVGEGSSLTSRTTKSGAQAIEAMTRALASGAEQSEGIIEIATPEAERERFRCAARPRAGGGFYATLEPLPSLAAERTARIEKTLLHMLMSTLDIVLWAIDGDGVFVFQRGKALATAGLEPGQFLGLKVRDIYPPELMSPIDACMKGTSSHGLSEAHGVHWETWYVPLKGESGEVEFTAGLTMDITATVNAKRELQRKVETIEAQKQAIQALSAPVLQIWNHVLAVPLIGVMDQSRTDELSTRLLAVADGSKVRYAILDLTGVDTLDTSVANHLMRLLASLKLLGVEGMVTGIRPHVAQTMIGLGIELESVTTHRSLRDALRECVLTLSRG